MGTDGRVSVGPLYSDRHGRYIGIEPQPLVPWWLWLLLGLVVSLFLLTLAPQSPGSQEHEAMVAALMAASASSGGNVEILDFDQWRMTPIGQDRILVRGIVSVPTAMTELHMRRAFMAQVHMPAGARLDDRAMLEAVETFSFQ